MMVFVKFFFRPNVLLSVRSVLLNAFFVCVHVQIQSSFQFKIFVGFVFLCHMNFLVSCNVKCESCDAVVDMETVCLPTFLQNMFLFLFLLLSLACYLFSVTAHSHMLFVFHRTCRLSLAGGLARQNPLAPSNLSLDTNPPP